MAATRIVPGTYTLSVYRTGLSVRTELSRVAITSIAAAFQP